MKPKNLTLTLNAAFVKSRPFPKLSKKPKPFVNECPIRWVKAPAKKI